jgi:general secretion pathway protein K
MIGGNKGSATLLCIFLSAIIITIGIGFNWLVKEHLRVADGLRQKTDAMIAAYSVFDTLMYFIVTGSKTPKSYINGTSTLLDVAEVPANGTAVKVKGKTFISVQDSSGLVSLSPENNPALRRLIAQFPGYEAPVIVDSYLDWIDIDDLVRLNGAEKFYYESAGKSYTPRNGPLQFKEEFALIRGVDRDLYQKMEPYITTLPSDGFNVNTASKTVIMAYLNVNEEIAKTLQDFVAKQPIQTPVAYSQTSGQVATGNFEFFPSAFMEIRIKSGMPHPLYQIYAGVHSIPKGGEPYTVLFWREN